MLEIEPFNFVTNRLFVPVRNSLTGRDLNRNPRNRCSAPPLWLTDKRDGTFVALGAACWCGAQATFRPLILVVNLFLCEFKHTSLLVGWSAVNSFSFYDSCGQQTQDPTESYFRFVRVSAGLFLRPNIDPNGCFGNQGDTLSAPLWI
ncbi:hypothetical protein GOODEAATRI_004777 [Goodea atripinnis]|uniref:Uncharacterized protein n=1 Tax=Goodea atripinnis TaxID=208336 RepID=A0ABV0PKW2_9TELE